VKQHINSQTFTSASEVDLVHSGYHHLIKMELVLAMIWLKNCSFDV